MFIEKRRHLRSMVPLLSQSGGAEIMKLVQFGAGNIGRSFIGQIFANAGWEVVFVDIDERIIAELNRAHRYRVIVKEKVEKTIEVANVRGVLASHQDEVAIEIASCDLVSTAVGQQALKNIIPLIARGIVERGFTAPERTLNIIICENMRNAASFFRNALLEAFKKNPDVLDPSAVLARVGLVETSIGKMVPIMHEEDRKKDPLLVFAEEYNSLILDRHGFLGTIPDVPQLEPKENIKAYVDRKLYIHNLGHAVLGYTAFVFGKGLMYVWEAAEDRALMDITRQAMWEAGNALIAAYPQEFHEKNIGEHIEDLLSRFKNRALGDTIYRVGRDLYRKLGPDDRLAGAVRLCEAHGIIPENICVGIACALFFKAADEKGRMFEKDVEFHEKEMKKGADHVLESVCGLKDEASRSLILHYYAGILRGERDIEKLKKD
jgi:mannitol-1-phosphate 5-dehydrogenase